MKKVLAAACLLLVSIPLFGQNTPALFWVREEIARPATVAQYEAASRDLMSGLAAQNADPKLFTIHTYVASDLHYLYVTPIASFATLDSMFGEWMKMAAAGGAKWTDVMKRSAASLDSYSDFVMTRRADLSYVAATPRVKPDDIRFVHLTYYRVDPAHTSDAEQVAKDWAALFKSKNVAESYSVYQVLSGHDLPLYIVADYAKDAADFYTAQQRVSTDLPEIRALVARAGAATRKVEFRDVIYRPDLSYPLPAAK